MKTFHYILIIALSMSWLGCADAEPQLPNGTTMPLVVEGWIEDGENPIVMVTRAVDMTQDVEDYSAFVQRWCRVSINDGDKTYWLTGHIDKNYTPSLIYTTSHLKGEIGRTYKLVVETETDTVWAESTIPPYATIDSLTIQAAASIDTLYQIRAYAKVSDSGLYKLFVRVRGEDTRFFSSMYGTFTGKDYNPKVGVDVRRGKHISFDDDTFIPFYKSGDIVNVKLCSMQAPVYDFWIAYENVISLSTNMFYSFTQGCPSNIVGGKGYWAAYGISSYSVKIP